MTASLHNLLFATKTKLDFINIHEEESFLIKDEFILR